jgi:nitrous oxidase accessory protein NosD/PKD repeat protein
MSIISPTSLSRVEGDIQNGLKLNGTIIVDQGGSGDYTTIQDAIDNSSNGDTIIINTGEYFENIIINKSITINGIGNPKPIINFPNEILNSISHDNVIISNLTFLSDNGRGLKIIRSNITLYNLSFYCYSGISVKDCNKLEVIKCYFNCSTQSILFNPGIEETLLISDCYFSGKREYNSIEQIDLNSGKNIIIKNSILENIDEVIDAHFSIDTILVKNTIFRNNNYTMHIRSKNITIENNIFTNNNEYHSAFDGCYNLNIIGNNHTSNIAGFLIKNTNKIRISDNKFSRNQDYSLKIENSNDILINNNVFSNNVVGLVIDECTGKTIWGNEFINNELQASDSSIGSGWNKNIPTGGNYWSDYVGQDIKGGAQQNEPGSDGFGDTPYNKNNVRDTYPIFIDTILPDAVAGPDMMIDLGEPFHFDATDSTDDQMVTDFEWSFEYDGEEVVRELAEFDFQFDIAGVYDCELTVSDFAGNVDTDSFTLTVEDSSAPVIVTQGNLTVNQGELAFFSAAGTTDLSPISEYKWSFQYEGKEEVLKGPDVSFRFFDVGVHEIQLKVTDSEGNFGYSYFYVTVIDTEDPVAVPGPDIEIENGEVVDFDGSESTDNDVIEEHKWTFRYGGRTETLSGENPSFLFNIPGYYTVTLTVKDAKGNSHSDSLQVTVIDTIDPEAVITGRTKLLEGDSLSLDGLSSTDNGRIVKYIWNFTDGEDRIIEGAYLNHTFERQGYIEVTLTVFDQWNNSNSKSVTVEVPDNERPKAAAGDDLTVKKGTTVTLDGSSSTDNGKISTWKWKFDYDGEEQVLEGDVVSFEFDHTGTYEIGLTVTDQFLNRGTDKIMIKVLDNGTLSGIVKDKDGNPIQGAKVTVIDSGGNQYTATTGTDGSFSVSVPEGQVTWKIEKSGYGKLEGTSSIEIMVDTDLSSSDTIMKKSEGDGGSPIVLIIIIVVILVLVGIGLAGFLIMKNRKTEIVEIEKPDSTDTSNEQENDLI